MAKGNRGRAIQQLDRASGNLDTCLSHLVKVRNMADEDDHDRITKFLDQIGKSLMMVQQNVKDLRDNL